MFLNCPKLEREIYLYVGVYIVYACEENGFYLMDGFASGCHILQATLLAVDFAQFIT